MDSVQVTAHRVGFEPLGRRGDASEEASLLECARGLGIDLISICGGHGHCGQCRVRVVAGETSEVTAAEREALGEAGLATGLRLACQVHPLGDCVVDVPADSLSTAMRSQVEGRETAGAVDPPVRAVEVELERPTLEHARADAEAL